MLIKTSIKISFIFLLILAVVFKSNAQGFVTKSIKDFGAKGNGRTDDQDAFVKASLFFNERKGKGKLIIPRGIYIVGRQKFNDNKNNMPAYAWENVLDLKDCSDLTIQGSAGAVLKDKDSLHIGTFYPANGKPFKHTIKDININPEYAKYSTNVGNMIVVSGCSNIRISGLMIDGNVGGYILGGNWGNGRNAYELIHYGIYIVDSHDVSVSNCNIKNFSCDGIYIANLGQGIKTYKINIDHCNVNYCGRNGLSWIGGENIRVSNSAFSNSGRGTVHESPAAGISIEVENSSFCRNGYFYRCSMENNVGSAITSGSAALSSNVLFKECLAASPLYYAVFVNAQAHVFENCRIYGTTLVWYRASGSKDAVKFTRCQFDENYKGKKMYDGSYLFGAEATALWIDSCVFRSYSSSSYYLNGLTNDCDAANAKKIHVSNCSFYNYCKQGFKLGENMAAIARYSVFYGNKFYSQPGVNFFNGFTNNCNADAGKNEFFPAPRK